MQSLVSLARVLEHSLISLSETSGGTLIHYFEHVIIVVEHTTVQGPTAPLGFG